MKYFGLWHKVKKCLLGFSVKSNNDSEFCNEVAYELETFSNNVWLVEKKETAEFARTHNTEWYNASYETPMNTYKPSDLEVKEVELKF